MIVSRRLCDRETTEGKSNEETWRQTWREGNRDADDRETAFSLFYLIAVCNWFSRFLERQWPSFIKLSASACYTAKLHIYQFNFCWSHEERSDSYLLRTSLCSFQILFALHGRLLELHNDKDYLHSLQQYLWPHLRVRIFRSAKRSGLTKWMWIIFKRWSLKPQSPRIYLCLF